MKTLLPILVCALLLLQGCDNADHHGVDPPCVVMAISMDEGNGFSGPCACVVVRDKDNQFFTECCSGWAAAIADSYQIGDTLR